MSLFRLLLFPLSVGTILLVSGAAAWQSLQPAPPPATARASTPVADPRAVQVLDQALTMLDPKHLIWVETGLWQRADVQGLAYEAQGRYLAGPNHRLRLELKTRVGTTEGVMQIVSNGTTLWHCTRIGGDAATFITRLDLNEVLRTLDHASTARQLRDEFFQFQSFAGVYPLLQGLQQQLLWTRKENVRRGGRELVKLSAVWPTATAEAFAPDGKTWPVGLPRQCRLYLEPGTLWPHRVEWWGPDPPRSGDVPLLQMEFRDPVLNRPIPEERCATEFAFDAGNAAVVDQTQLVADQLRLRVQELTPQ